MLRLTFYCVLLGSCGWIFAETAPAVCLTDDESEVQDLIYLGPSAPIFVRLRIRINGTGLRIQREDYAAQLLDKLDTSGDGVLTEAEIDSIPPIGHLVPVSGNNPTPTTPNIGAVDADQNGTVTREELTRFVLAASGAPFQINAEIQQLSDGQPVELFDRLDRNQDRRLDPDELLLAARRLRLMDSDFDDRITSDEIRIPSVFGIVQQDANPTAGQASAALALFEPIDRSYVDDSVIRTIIQKYDKLARGAGSRRFIKDGRLSAEEFSLPPDVLAAHDTNGDDLLDQKELRSLLTNPQPTYEIMIEFGRDLSGSRTELLKRGNPTQPAPLDFDTGQEERIIVKLGDTHLELAADPEVRPVRAAGFVGAFKNTDRDKNDYLDLNEFRQLGNIGANHFRLVDTDGDGMVVEKEFTSFANQQAELQKHVVSLNLAGNDRSLFEIADSSGDGMLDAGELDALQSRILETDSDNDGILRKEELSESLRMILTRGNTEIRNSRNNAKRVRMGASAVRQPRTNNNWFAGMDRNNDGKVSRREFLGPIEVFAKMDADANGWLDATEADDLNASENPN